MKNTMEITRQMVEDFRTATRDTNKIHQGEKAIALGFQMASILSNYARKLFSEQGFDWTSQITRFETGVRAGSKVTIDCDLVGQEGNAHDITIKLTDSKDNTLAISTLKYGPERAIERITPKGHIYTITREDAEKTARGIGKTGTDISALVRGLSSNALYKDGSEVIEKAAQQKELVPVYIRHQIEPTPAERQLKIGSTIYIATNAPDVAKKIELDLSKGKDTRRRTYTTEATATTEDGQKIYDGRLTLVLIKKTDFESQRIT